MPLKKKASATSAGPLKPWKTFGITRIEQVEKSNVGYYVRVNKTAKWFSDRKHGGTKKALAAATVLRDELFYNLPEARQKRAAKKHVYSAKTV